MIEYITTFIACVFAGVLTGLVGIGGGLVIVPSFLIVSEISGLSFSMHQIIGISATAVFFNSIITLFYRRKEEFLPLKENIKNSCLIVVGAFFGACVSKYISSFYLSIIYLFVCSLSVILLFKKPSYKFSDLFYLRHFWFFVSGALSSCVGIGGAIFFTIILRSFYKKPTKAVLASITLLVAVNATFAFIGKLYVGDVVIRLLPFVILGGFIGSKVGVLVSKRLSSRALRYIMIATCIVGILTVAFKTFLFNGG